MVNMKIASSIALLSAAVSANAIPSHMLKRDSDTPPQALPQSADQYDLQFQPVLDYDTDSCYNVPAIDANGNLDKGLSNTYTTNTADGCRTPSYLDNQNVYARTRCNNGWCARMYEHYFQKDVGLENVAGVASGHRYEWENVVVWTQDGQDHPSFVAVSQHDGYQVKSASDIRFQGTMVRNRVLTFLSDHHPKVVYNKAGSGTHDFRFANEGDDAIENDKGTWIQGALVGFWGYPSTDIRDKMIQNWANNGIKCKIETAIFAEYLKKSVGSNDVGNFDFNSDS
ncbi:necrosis inducing protein [Seiridium cupressi]|uniref:Necrosis inducing protein-domain-containing protein n=1 Tax=Seiridium unicorne TaxID=138068 RepID=A0ABR2VIY3_9PEZI